MATKTKNSTKSTKRTTVTTYVPVSDHIYFDGYSYRVRACVDGTKYSKSLPSKKKAYAYRKQLLASTM